MAIPWTISVTTKRRRLSVGEKKDWPTAPTTVSDFALLSRSGTVRSVLVEAVAVCFFGTDVGSWGDTAGPQRPDSSSDGPESLERMMQPGPPGGTLTQHARSEASAVAWSRVVSKGIGAALLTSIKWL